MNSSRNQAFFGTSYDFDSLGAEMHELCRDLFPICRSITGPGVRETLNTISAFIDLQQHEVPSGEQVFDWSVPQEWRCYDAYISDTDGNRLIDFNDNTLHVMSYSTPIDATMELHELDLHLYSLPNQPNLIPYRTSYYNKNWGFCLTEHQRRSLGKGPFRVRINSQLTKGSMTYGEFFIKGKSDEELLFSTHICHPSLANDNLSGISVATMLGRLLEQTDASLYYSIRIIFIPATIGAITWLSRNKTIYERIAGGAVLSGIGDSGPFTYKLSRRGDGILDHVLPYQMTQTDIAHEVRDYSPYGYDERQFCSLGPDIPMGCLMRTPFGEYPEYHTSGDNLDFIHPQQLAESLRALAGAVEHAQKVRKYINLNPNCEPQLGRRGLYDAIGGDNDTKTSQMALLWMLSASDGATTTHDIHMQSGLPIDVLCVAADRLEEAKLLRCATSV